MDVSNLCRSCMEEIASWENEGYDEKMMEMFSFCTSIEITEEDKMPRSFCYNCTVSIESSYAYIRTARRINGKLKRLVQNSSTNNFVDTFLNKNNFVDTKPNGKLDDINSNQKETKILIKENITVNDLDYDLFDDEDDKCLSEFKTKEVKIEIKEEPSDETENKTEELPAEVNNESIKNDKIRGKKCKICKKIFTRRGWYFRHMKRYHPEKELKEKDLAKKRKKIIYKETKVTEDLENDIKCRICMKTFNSKHMRTKHLCEAHSEVVGGQKVYLCPYCPQTFLKYAKMYYHTKSHPDLKKHQCPTCGKTYAIRNELEQHLRTHPNTVKGRPYACDKCDMRLVGP